MAEEMELRPSGAPVKIRSLWGVALLPIITLGIYHLVWWYRVNRELSDFGRDTGQDLGQNPLYSLLALFPGSIIIIPALVTYWRGTQRIQRAAQIAGREPPIGWVAILLYIAISLGLYAYLQSSLNAVWRAKAVPTTTAIRR